MKDFLTGCAQIYFPVNDTRLDIALAPAGMWTVLDVARSASGSFPKFPYHLNFLKCRHQSPISLTFSLFLGRQASPHNIFMQIAPNLMWLLSNFDNEIR